MVVVWGAVYLVVRRGDWTRPFNLIGKPGYYPLAGLQPVPNVVCLWDEIAVQMLDEIRKVSRK
jgi:hypothetical protein